MGYEEDYFSPLKKKESIQDDILFAEREEFTDEELLLAFGDAVTRNSVTADEIREYILPQVHGLLSYLDDPYSDVNSLIDFEGRNCEDCTGWNGVDRRCSCGNRRVYWERSKDGFNAVAY